MRRSKMEIYLILAVSTASLLALPGCSGCQGKKDRSTNDSVINPATEDPEPSPTVSAAEHVEDVGEEVPPIETDSVSTIDTSKKAALKHLIFNADNNMEAGRFLSEFLVIIRSNEPSCVRFRVRPTSGLDAEVSDDILKEGVIGDGACKGQKVGGEDSAAPAEDDTKKEATLALNAEPSSVPDYDWITDGGANSGLNLAASAPAICSTRLFRMENGTATYPGTAKGLENIATKTGRLLVINKKVRVWLDQEYSNICTNSDSADTLNTLSPVPFAPILQQAGGTHLDPDSKDLLLKEHLENLADEMDKIITAMTDRFGANSDLDNSGYIEIFLSPSVNRAYFNAFQTSDVDLFRASMVFRPQDLAFYNPQTNPLSNEGEILYLWTPDPAGIYNYVQFPSANSISSNYAKGYLTAQMMTIIIANQKLFVNKLKAMEDRWLVESLAGLASAYYAGNDFTLDALANFLSSRPQYISLTEELDKTLISGKYIGFARDEQFGMRTLFGWYLHSRLCGPSKVEPCDKLKDLITSKDLGLKNLQAVLGEPISKTLEGFALTLGIELIDHPSEGQKFWKKKPLPANMPPKPVGLPALTAVSEAGIRVTAEENNIPVYPNFISGDQTDQSTAGPLTSKKMLIFQALGPDNDMEFKLAKNSISYVLVTGLIEQQTDMTALFGKGLNVVFIPIGDRDSALRRIHLEKVSDQSHSDTRPENLTTQKDPNTTYMYDNIYDPSSYQYTVNSEREIWTLGSIDNYTVNVSGSAQTIGDSDAYEIEFKPCETKTGAEKTTCEATTHTAMVQVIIRDFEKELAPMLVVTEPDRKIFRGHSVFGRLVETGAMLSEAFSQTGNALVYKTATPTVIDYARFPNSFSGEVIIAGHNFVNGDIIQFKPQFNAFPNGVKAYTDYLVEYVDANHIRISRSGVYPTIQNYSKMESYLCQSENAWSSAIVTFDYATSSVNMAAHGYVSGNQVRFKTNNPAGMPRGLRAEKNYTVATTTANSFTLEDGGVPVEIGQSGTLTVENAAGMRLPATMTLAAAGTVTSTGHGFSTDDPLRFWSTGDLPSGVIPGQTYYAKVIDPNTFTFAATASGADIATNSEAVGPFSIVLGQVSRCANGGFTDAFVYDHDMTKVNPKAYAHTYDNFLMMGPLGFPYTNMNMITYKDAPICEGFRCYLEVESSRQHLIFKLDPALRPTVKGFFASSSSVGNTGLSLTYEMTATLAGIKRKIDHCNEPDPQSDAFVAECSGVAGLSESDCVNICGANGNKAQNQILSFIFENKAAASCYNPGFCVNAIELTQPGNYTSAWLSSGDFFWFAATDKAYKSFYTSIEPQTKNDYCSGEATTSSHIATCRLREDAVDSLTDIRQQLNVSYEDMAYAGNCSSKLIGTDFKACIDVTSALRELQPNTEYLYQIAKQFLPATDRKRYLNRNQWISYRAGEVINKPERLQSIMFKVPGTGGIANVIVGGRNQSQGKYLLRARIWKEY